MCEPKDKCTFGDINSQLNSFKFLHIPQTGMLYLATRKLNICGKDVINAE